MKVEDIKEFGFAVTSVNHKDKSIGTDRFYACGSAERALEMFRKAEPDSVVLSIVNLDAGNLVAKPEAIEAEFA